MPKRENKDAAPQSQGFIHALMHELLIQATEEDVKLCAAAILSLIRTFPDIGSRLKFLLHGTFTPEGGLFDTNMLAFLQNREPDTIRKWAETRDVPVHKTGKQNSYRGADVVAAARMSGGAEDVA